MIVKIDYHSIYIIWKKHLWPERQSEITSTSAMNFLSGYDTKNMDYEPTFFAYIENDILQGVNSGHMCYDQSYRSRGLYVFPEYRKKGIGTKLLTVTIEQSKIENAKFIWSYPKQSSWNTYSQAGFSLASPWEMSELGFNAYCIKAI